MPRLLAEIAFFEGCTEPELRDIAHLTEERRIPAGSDLCRQGDLENNALVILEGEADVVIDGRSLGTTAVGEIVGALAMLGSGKRTAIVRATSPMHVLVLDPREVDSVLAADPSSARRLTQHGGQGSSAP
jgi:CRP-like cAMP-binding protein